MYSRVSSNSKVTALEFFKKNYSLLVIVIIGADQSHQSENIERKKEIFFKRNVKYFDYGLFVISTLILLLCDDFVLTQNINFQFPK